MQILTNNNVVFNYGETIECGTWENDPTMETYRIKNGENYQYAVIADFGLYKVDSLPEDFEPNKYCYTETNGFYINPNYVELKQYGIPDELLQQIKDDTIQEVQDSVQ